MSVAISQLDSLIEEMEIINGNCKEKCDQDGENGDDVKIDLEDQLDQLTEKLKNAMDTGVDLKESLGRWYIFFFSFFMKLKIRKMF